jgi:uncharacterized phage-associated protein
MVAARDVAAHIEHRLPGLTEFALFKILYYAQAWHVTWEGTKLFPERIEAWRNGPVAASLWRERQKDPRPPRAVPLPEDVRHIVDSIVAFYGHMPGGDLVDLTHAEDPWMEARRGLPDNVGSDEEVTSQSMRRYYTLKLARGESAPRRPQIDERYDNEAVMTAAECEFPRWSETLDRLAQ